MIKPRNILRRLKRAFAGFLLGIVVGAVIGALGGTMDKGSMMILMPSGPPFWAIVGAFFGSIVGALYGAFSRSSSQDVTSLKS
jgi:membrane associated rhomboid family serine protease